MQREIKFRGWIRCGEWIEPEDEKQKFVMVPGEALAFEEYEPLCDLLRDVPDRAYYMQYTGLKDMHGCDIYEGDILRINGGAEDVFAEVGFEHGCFVARVPWCDGVKISYPGLKYYIGMPFIPIYAIIGNIYENPGLLEAHAQT